MAGFGNHHNNGKTRSRRSVRRQAQRASASNGDAQAPRRGTRTVTCYASVRGDDGRWRENVAVYSKAYKGRDDAAIMAKLWRDMKTQAWAWEAQVVFEDTGRVVDAIAHLPRWACGSYGAPYQTPRAGDPKLDRLAERRRGRQSKWASAGRTRRLRWSSNMAATPVELEGGDAHEAAVDVARSA